MVCPCPTAMAVTFLKPDGTFGSNPHATPPAIGSWAAPISTNYTTLSWDITSSVTARGEIDVSFCWKTGANGLDIAWAALFENGVELDRDTHAGSELHRVAAAHGCSQ